MKKSESILQTFKNLAVLQKEVHGIMKKHLIGRTCTHRASGLKCTITSVTIHDYYFTVQVGIKTSTYNTVGFLHEVDIDE